LSVLDDTAYVAYLVYEGYDVVESGLVAIDIEDPYNLTTIDKYANMDLATDVHAVGDLVYATDEIRGMIVLKFESAD